MSKFHKNIENIGAMVQTDMTHLYAYTVSDSKDIITTESICSLPPTPGQTNLCIGMEEFQETLLKIFGFTLNLTNKDKDHLTEEIADAILSIRIINILSGTQSIQHIRNRTLEMLYAKDPLIHTMVKKTLKRKKKSVYIAATVLTQTTKAISKVLRHKMTHDELNSYFEDSLIALWCIIYYFDISPEHIKLHMDKKFKRQEKRNKTNTKG